MSAHSCFHDWRLGDPEPEGLIDDIASCVRANQGHLMAFYIGCQADQLIWFLTQQLDQNKDISDEKLEQLAGATAPNHEQCARIMKAVVANAREKDHTVEEAKCSSPSEGSFTSQDSDS